MTIGKLVSSAGGRGFIFALAAVFWTALFTHFGTMTWDQWVEYNKAIGLAFMTAKALEGGAASIAGRKKGGES